MACGIECVCTSFISSPPSASLETEMRIAKNLVSGEKLVCGKREIVADQP
jgi:hypothetical protein